MLKVEFEKGHLVELRCCGTTAEIGSEVLSLIAHIYEGISGDADQLEFRMNMVELLPACFMSQEERSDFLKKAEKMHEQSANENIDELLKQLDELKGLIAELKEENNEDIGVTA